MLDTGWRDEKKMIYRIIRDRSATVELAFRSGAGKLRPGATAIGDFVELYLGVEFGRRTENAPRRIDGQAIDAARTICAIVKAVELANLVGLKIDDDVRWRRSTRIAADGGNGFIGRRVLRKHQQKVVLENLQGDGFQNLIRGQVCEIEPRYGIRSRKCDTRPRVVCS